MPWVLQMTFSPEQAEALRLGGIYGGQVEHWHLKKSAALDFPTSWLPKYGRVAVRLTIEGEDGQAAEVREIAPALPDPIPHYDKTPEQFAKPVIPGVVEARLFRSNKKAPFLPIVCLHDRETRHAVDRYLSGCSFSEVRDWLQGVGDLEFTEDVSLSDKPEDKVHKYRFISRDGYDTIVDITTYGIHIVY